MKQLENRTLDSKREMDIMAALDEMQSLNARHARVDTEAALAALKRSALEDEAAGQIDLDEEDEAVLRQMIEQVSFRVLQLAYLLCDLLHTLCIGQPAPACLTGLLMLAQQYYDTHRWQSELTVAFELDQHFASLYISSICVQEHACMLLSQAANANGIHGSQAAMVCWCPLVADN